jgi:hypothetical protein
MDQVPSIRHLSESTEPTLRSIESKWHKIFVGWQAVLGQLKVKQAEEKSKSFFASWFKK